jgi:predicted acyltransferase
MTTTPLLGALPPHRLVSLDVFRGLIMFLLAAEAAEVYDALEDLVAGTPWLEGIVRQFHHHPWNGLRFWDLIQPFFMFIVGVAMVFSVQRRRDHGETWGHTFRHIATRCTLLLAFGVALHCVYAGELVWELWNVLSQLSVTILVAFLLFNLPFRTQLVISLALLGLTELLYRTFPVAGFDQPFVQGQNFGAYMDLVLMGKINDGGWVAINALPTSAHTIWGVLAGKWLRADRPAADTIRALLIWGFAGLVVGYGMDLAGVTPIIKRICTSSFVLASGGWCLMALAAAYTLVDVKGYRRFAPFFIVIGANSIFIYLFSETVGKQWVNGFVGIFTNGVLAWMNTPGVLAAVVTAITVLLLEWSLCLALYRRGWFFKV